MCDKMTVERLMIPVDDNWKNDNKIVQWFRHEKDGNQQINLEEF